MSVCMLGAGCCDPISAATLLPACYYQGEHWQQFDAMPRRKDKAQVQTAGAVDVVEFEFSILKQVVLRSVAELSLKLI